MYNVYYVDDRVKEVIKDVEVKEYFNVVSGTFNTLEEAKAHLQKIFTETYKPNYKHEAMNSVTFKVYDTTNMLGNGYAGLAYVKHMEDKV